MTDVRILKKKSCIGCHRVGAPLSVHPVAVPPGFPPLHIEAPWCEETADDTLNLTHKMPCKPLTPAEKADPEMKRRWTHSMYAAERVDAGMRELLEFLRGHGVGTLFSCDGHGERTPYIEFYDEEDLARGSLLTAGFLRIADLPQYTYVKRRDHYIVGTLPKLYVSPKYITPSPRPPRRPRP